MFHSRFNSPDPAPWGAKEAESNQHVEYGGGGASPFTRADPSSTLGPAMIAILEPHRASWITFLLHRSTDHFFPSNRTVILLFLLFLLCPERTRVPSLSNCRTYGWNGTRYEYDPDDHRASAE